MSAYFAGVGYHLRLLVFRQSALAPVVVYLALVGVVYTSSAGPPVGATSVTAPALFPIAAWIARLVATGEAAPYAEVTLTAAGGRRRLGLMRFGATLAVGTLLSVLTTLWSLAADTTPYQHRWSEIAIVLGMSLAECIAGAGLGAWLGPELPSGAALTAVLAVGVISLVVKWVPPLNPLIRGLDQPPVPDPLHVFAFVGQAAGFGLLLLTARLIRRR